MSNTNAFVFALPVKIIQLVVNIIFGSVYKMLETLLVVILVGLIGLFGSLAYLLGRIHGLKARMGTISPHPAKLFRKHFIGYLES